MRRRSGHTAVQREACCHDKYEWFDQDRRVCPGCSIVKINWLEHATDDVLGLKRAVETAAPDRIGVQILGDAADVIDGERQQNYGNAETNLGRIAALWSVILGHSVEPHQAALCMTALKLARLIETPDHHDSFVDACGYLALGAELTLKETP